MKGILKRSKFRGLTGLRVTVERVAQHLHGVGDSQGIGCPHTEQVAAVGLQVVHVYLPLEVGKTQYDQI